MFGFSLFRSNRSSPSARVENTRLLEWNLPASVGRGFDTLSREIARCRQEQTSPWKGGSYPSPSADEYWPTGRQEHRS